MKAKFYVFSIAASMLAIIACKKDSVEENTPSNDTPSTLTCAERAVTFSANIEPYITATCATPGCHNASTSGGVRLETYEQISAEAKNSRFINVIKHTPGFSPMPKGRPKASADQIAEIECWISDGTPNN